MEYEGAENLDKFSVGDKVTDGKGAVFIIEAKEEFLADYNAEDDFKVFKFYKLHTLYSNEQHHHDKVISSNGEDIFLVQQT